MYSALFGNISETDKNTAIENIIQHASPRHDFFMMLFLSIAMAAFGVLLNSTIILIGSMLIAPLLYPLLSLALGIIASDETLIAQSMYTVFRSIGLALLTGFVIGILFSGITELTGSPFIITAGGSASLAYTVVAVIAGFAAAFAMTKPLLNETLPGVAIAVALVPPLAVAGVGLSMFNWQMISTGILLFMVNVVGIVFSAMIVFALLRFSVKRNVTKEVVKEEEKIIKKESEPKSNTKS